MQIDVCCVGDFTSDVPVKPALASPSTIHKLDIYGLMRPKTLASVGKLPQIHLNTIARV